MNALGKDISVAARQFRRHPGFPLAVVWTLALVTAASLAVFSLVNAVLFRALPFAAPDQLVWITSVRPDHPAAPFSLPEFMDYRSQTRAASIAAYAYWRASLAGSDLTEGLQGARFSANAFQVLGLTPAAGRLLRDSDDDPGAPKVAVISYRLWQRRFGGSVAAVGQMLRINGESYLFAGVLPVHFPWPLRDIDVVVPLAPDRDPYRHLRNSTNFLRFFGRLQPGASREHAEAEMTTICRSLRRQFPVEYARKDAVRIVPLHEALIADYRQAMLLLFCAVLVVLGAALANLVSLALARANARRAELVIRVAMGASRRRLAQQLLVESVLQAGTGAGLGCLLAVWTVAAVLPWAPASIPRLTEVSIDGNSLAFGALIAAGAAMLLTVAPLGVALQTSAGDALRMASRGAVSSRRGGRVRQILVAAEISAALVLLLTTTTLVQNLVALQTVRLGFDPDVVFQARISIPPAYQSPDDLARFYDRLLERLIGLPGVEHAGLINVAPLSGLLRTVPFTVEGEAQAERDLPNVNLRIISPGYLPAVGTRLIQGRSLLESDGAAQPPVALVSAALATRFLNNQPLGRRLLLNDNSRGPRPVEVIGVVGDVRQEALDVPPALEVYVPLRQIHPEAAALLQNNQFWMLRTSTTPGALRSSFVAQLRAVDPDAAISSAGAMRDFVEAGLGPRRFHLGLFVAFSLSGALLAVSGVYGLVSYAVSQRRQEVGLRMAIGACQADIQRLIVRRAVLLGLAGALPGSGIAALAQRLAPGAAIPWGWGAAVAAGLLALVALAAWLPARRAARISPAVALRGE